MNDIVKQKINGFGELFRFITPTLLAIIGTLIITGQNDIKTKLSCLDTHFMNHLEHHQDLEVGYERRLSKLESKAAHCEESIKNANAGR